MDWWRKIRRTLTALSSGFKLCKSPVGGVAGGKGDGDCGVGGGGVGLLKLQDDVRMCGYSDVEVMWNMLSISLQPAEQVETERRRTKVKLPKRRSISRLFFLTNHNP